MSDSIQDVYVRTYETNVRHLAQQGITRLRPYVLERSVSSEAHNWERMHPTDQAVVKTGRGGATPQEMTAWSRRQSVPTTFQVGDITGTEDIVQMIVDPNSNYAKAHGKEMRRQQDRDIIEAAVGDSRDGAGAAVPFDANQNIGDGTGAFTYDTITAVSEKFMDNDVDPDEPKIFVVSPAMARKLLQTTEFISGDYNARRPLTEKGYIDNHMGYSWVVSTLLQSPGANERYAFAMTFDAIGLQMNRDITAEIQKDPSASFDWRIYCEGTWGAIRIQDEKLVRVHIDETI